MSRPEAHGSHVSLMATELADAMQEVATHYATALAQHGPTPPGVDWPHRVGQEIRFIQLLRVVGNEPRFSLTDFGCGYGGLFGFLRRRMSKRLASYLGIDLVPTMIAAARRRYHHTPIARFVAGSRCLERTDYTVASGVFNVRLHATDRVWESFVADTLHDMFANSTRGCAVNFLAREADGRPAREGLYRSAPERWASFCETELGATVTLVQGYGQREYTLLIRRRGQQ